MSKFIVTMKIPSKQIAILDVTENQLVMSCQVTFDKLENKKLSMCFKRRKISSNGYTGNPLISWRSAANHTFT